MSSRDFWYDVIVSRERRCGCFHLRAMFECKPKVLHCNGCCRYSHSVIVRRSRCLTLNAKKSNLKAVNFKRGVVYLCLHRVEQISWAVRRKHGAIRMTKLNKPQRTLRMQRGIRNKANINKRLRDLQMLCFRSTCHRNLPALVRINYNRRLHDKKSAKHSAAARNCSQIKSQSCANMTYNTWISIKKISRRTTIAKFAQLAPRSQFSSNTATIAPAYEKTLLPKRRGFEKSQFHAKIVVVNALT